MVENYTSAILGMSAETKILLSCVIVAGAYLIDFLCCRILVPLIRKVALKTSFKWDNYITGRKVLENVFHLIPPVTFYAALPLLFPEPAIWTDLLSKAFSIYIIIVAGHLVCEFISSLYDISSETEALKNKPMKGVYQMLKVVVICICVILIIGVLIEKDFTTLIAGLGASAAVLMLIFKDTILGLVAGVQLSAHDMLRPGDWIMNEKYDVDGVVEEVNLNTIKIRNWDKTVTTIPPYALVSDSFKNWRGMRESGGRRVMRSVRIDMNSIRFCTTVELEKFSGAEWAKGVYMDDKTVNLKLFRMAMESYLRKLSTVNSRLMLMVRQLEPTSEGLPLQLYFFTVDKDWVPHEHIAADVMEHAIASLPEFGLRVYQKPSGFDFAENRNEGAPKG